MKGKKFGNKWIIMFFSIVSAISILLMSVCYIVDPFFQYRIRDNTYMVSNKCVPGIIKNHDYDTLVIGSSMTENFKMDSFREKLGEKPAKVSISGMTLGDMETYIKLANDVGRAETYYICIDLPRFVNAGISDRANDYLIDDNIFNDYKYLLGYFAWMRFIPVDLGLMAAKKMDIPLGERISSSMSIDDLGYWGDDFKFGRDFAVNSYRTTLGKSVPKTVADNYYKDMVENTDKLIELLDVENCEYNFFFPPYSVLYWARAEKEGYLEQFLNGKEYIAKRLNEKGCNVYDFQYAEFISDLDNYKDVNHYSPEINEWMVDCFSKRLYLINDETVGHGNKELKGILKTFKEDNSDIFE